MKKNVEKNKNRTHSLSYKEDETEQPNESLLLRSV